jgi:hypothetical protein
VAHFLFSYTSSEVKLIGRLVPNVQSGKSKFLTIPFSRNPHPHRLLERMDANAESGEARC